MYRSVHGMIKALELRALELTPQLYCDTMLQYLEQTAPRRPIDGPSTHETNFPVHATVTGPDFS